MNTRATPRPLTALQRAAARTSRDRMMMRARRFSRLGRYRLHAAVLLPLLLLLRLLPLETAARLGGWIGRRLMLRLDDGVAHRRTIRIAFPDFDDAACDRLLADMAENIGTAMGEFQHLGAFAGHDNPRLKLTGVHNVRAAQALDSGVLFVAGHFANWDVFEVALASLGLSGARVLKHPTNPYLLEAAALDRYAWGLDEQIAQGEGVFVRSRAVLRAGRVVQILCDQLTARGARVPFFGVPTTTNLLPARLARETGAPIVLMAVRRLGPARFEIAFQPPRRYDMADDETEIMRGVNAFFEDQIVKAPAMWLWRHPRWQDVLESRPPAPLVTPPLGDQ